MKKLLILITILSIGISSYEQEFLFPLYLEDSLGYKDTLFFGYDDNATNLIDSSFGETNIKSQPFRSFFEARISNYFSSNYGLYIVDPTTFHTKKQIKKKDCISNNWPFVSAIILSKVKFPLKVYWDTLLFINSCRQNSLITDWHPSGWFDALYGIEHAPVYLKSDNKALFNYTTHHFITTTNDSLSVLFISIASEYNFTSGIHENKDQEKINIFPNPTSNYFTIQFNDASLKINAIYLYNIVGKSQQLKLINNTVDLVELPNGLYFIRILFENGQEITKKIIKK